MATYARRLARLMPILGDIKILRQWAGPYDQSPDGNPIVGNAPGHPDFFLACGFVGHGFMMAPIVGKLYGEWSPAARSTIFERYTLHRFSDGSAAKYARGLQHWIGVSILARLTRSGLSVPATWPRR